MFLHVPMESAAFLAFLVCFFVSRNVTCDIQMKILLSPKFRVIHNSVFARATIPRYTAVVRGDLNRSVSFDISIF